MNIFWEAQQQHRIASASAAASSARDRVARLQSEVDALQRRLERVALASQALWELLRDHTDFTEDHIVAKMQQIDMRDGAADGKIGHRVLECAQCGRTANSARSTCIYCGAELPREHVFE